MRETEANIWSELSNQPDSNGGLKIGLAVATLVLGIVSIAMAMFVTGVIFGLAGAILGIVCLAGKSRGKGMVGCGLGLSVVGILISCCFGLLYYGAYSQRNASFEKNEEKTGLFNEWVGEQAPDFTVTDVEGNSIKLSELRGSCVVLNFWWPSSLRSRDAIPHFVELRRTVPEEDLVIIGISSVDTEELKGLGGQLGINYPLVSTEELPSLFDVHWALTTFFIDRNGIIQSVLDEYHSFKKIKSRALALDYGKYEAQEGQVLKSERVSDD